MNNWKRDIVYLIVVIIAVVVSIEITKTVVNSDMPLWLKVFLLG